MEGCLKVVWVIVGVVILVKGEGMVDEVVMEEGVVILVEEVVFMVVVGMGVGLIVGIVMVIVC